MALRFNEGEDDAIVAEINITPLTDIFLVLLIIFMISSSAILENTLQLRLPHARTSAPMSASGEPIFIAISREGMITVNEQATRDDALEGSIREALARTSDKAVTIRGDESLPLRIAVKVMDAARSAGAEKIALATRPAE